MHSNNKLASLQQQTSLFNADFMPTSTESWLVLDPKLISPSAVRVKGSPENSPSLNNQQPILSVIKEQPSVDAANEEEQPSLYKIIDEEKEEDLRNSKLESENNKSHEMSIEDAAVDRAAENASSHPTTHCLNTTIDKFSTIGTPDHIREMLINANKQPQKKQNSQLNVTSRQKIAIQDNTILEVNATANQP